MAATLTATPSAHIFEKQDVVTDINFWKRLAEPSKIKDFRLSEAEKEAEKEKEKNEHDDPRQVTIHDIRGEEQNYTLLKNGFQFVQHEVPELKEGADSEEVKRILVPATEQLVKKT
jgi:hypothetical protein